MANRLDIVIFGVTGFTGLRTIPYLTRIIESNRLSLTWGVAGRSENKIKQSLQELGKKHGVSYDNVPIIIADVNDEGSLIKMTSQAKIIVNATGPYRLYGEPVVKACIETSTHHVDLSGEGHFIEGMQLKYHDKAKEKGVYIISACGVDSIPADLGVVYLQNNFAGTLNSVETYVYATQENPDLPGPMINTGTYQSGVHSLGHQLELYKLRKQLCAKKLPQLKPKLKTHLIHKSNLINRWSAPIPEPDLPIMRRSQRFFYELYNQRPVQVQCYAGVESLFYLILMGFYGFIIVLFSQFSCTRNLLLKHPKFFTNGVFSNEGPSDEKQESTLYNLILRGRGWSETLKDPTEEPAIPPTKQIVAKISGKNPGYGITCAAFALSAVIILTEKDKMPKEGGVYPPAVAFFKTTMIDKLQENGVSFEIISKN